MNGLERTQKSIKGEPLDRIPFFPISLGNACELEGVNQKDFFLDSKVLADTLLRFRERIGGDGIYVSRDNWVYHEALGGELIFPDNDETYSKKTILSSISEYKKLEIPDSPNAPGMKTVLDAAKRVVDAVGDKFYIQANIDTGPFSLGAVLLGAEKFIIELLSAGEDDIKGLMEFCTEAVISYGKAMMATGVHGIQFGDATASLLGPDHFEEFGLPWIKKAVAGLTGYNSDIWIHICGKTDQFLHLLKDVPFQGFEVDAMVPLKLARDLLGDKIALKGNIDTAFLWRKSANEVYDATLNLLRECSFSSGLIMSPGCGVPRMTPAENLIAMRNACEDYNLKEIV